ncbi:hypothetical protein RB614_03550 [Phytohabitans sp. ZYX-F-186]|uniref:Uncharacterized protein n=1 Tax=Phytohabitans maris TaxID=3071409 RepID=A0ABU0Z952_9ACTN|nr:hypothetical protein [Phytohabitans sp. ZYX-F-186]MDQ7903588.1 hypothetical protein [Phytohabitans sp. ZYX-F-186]
MDDVERLLPSPAFAALVAVVVVLCLATAALREAWLGEDSTVDPVVAGVRVRRAARLRRALLSWARTLTAVLLALSATALVVLTIVRIAVLAEGQGGPPG